MDLAEPRALLGYQSETGHQTWSLSKGQSRVELCVSHSEERARNPKVRAELIKTKLDWPDAREGQTKPSTCRVVTRKGPCLQSLSWGSFDNFHQNAIGPAVRTFALAASETSPCHICKSWTSCACGSQQSTRHI